MFLAPRFMSMNIHNIFAASHLNKYTFLDWTKAQHIQLMRALPWDSTFSKYIKGTSDKDKPFEELCKIFERAWEDTALKPEEIRKAIEQRLLSEEEVEKTLVRLGTETKKFNRLLNWYKEELPF